MSLIQDALRKLLALKPNAFESVQSIQEDIRFAAPRADISDGIKKSCDVSVEYFQERQVITLCPKNSQPTQTLIYIHGGAFVHDLVSAHWHIIHAIIKRTGCRVVVPIYRLAPYATIDSELLILLDLYAQQTDEVFVAGDSAGGNLSLVLAIALRNQNKPLPKAVFLFSPALNWTLDNPNISEVAPHDPMLAKDGLAWCGQAWAGSRAVSDPFVSPIFDHLNDLPPLHIYQGTYDILYPDVQKLAEKLSMTNTPHKLHIFEKAFHVFMAATFTLEAKKVFDDVAAVMKR
ncbi:alpha/beta hydrolase fold domain-containing protein [Neisseria leonii]|uniref:alpha/beta hydrolase fold domain-containing protein n=1 Tax=Neisseria leonii TaxID=2995413 RepID=UPI00237BD8E8|nr:alpha/beta hydrolase [Neisseria sp. 3986]MDD9325209.1 alpha/beta hydrolase [Neisseria sp. 3986]